MLLTHWRAAGRLAGRLDGGQQQRDQDGDDGDDDQQLDQREAASRVPRHVHLPGIAKSSRCMTRPNGGEMRQCLRVRLSRTGPPYKHKSSRLVVRKHRAYSRAPVKREEQRCCTRFRVWRSATIVLAVAGCGGKRDGIAREPVSGKVTLDGKALENGQITFSPEAGGQPAVAAIIKDGAYSLSRATARGPSRSGQCLVPKAHREEGPERRPPGTFVEETARASPTVQRQSDLKADVKQAAATASTSSSRARAR